MNNIENNILQILLDLKQNHNAIALKSEFEAEGATVEETLALKDFAQKTDLDLAIKIGGCEAIKDLKEAQSIDAEVIVAPMIESCYALEKYAKAIKSIYNSTEVLPKFFFNIETITGFNNLDEILSSEFSSQMDGIVFGRSDMCGSLGLSSLDVNSDEMLNFANQIASKVSQYEKELIIGGSVSALSVPFFSKVQSESFRKIETRKVVFDVQKSLNKNSLEEGIEKAIDFELLWLEYKIQNSWSVHCNDFKRIESLKSLLKSS
jgi:hypothetical protein